MHEENNKKNPHLGINNSYNSVIVGGVVCLRARNLKVHVGAMIGFEIDIAAQSLILSLLDRVVDLTKGAETMRWRGT